MPRALITSVRYITSSQVADLLGVHSKTLARYLREGRIEGFPAYRAFADGRRRWVLAEVEEWIARPTETSGHPLVQLMPRPFLLGRSA